MAVRIGICCKGRITRTVPWGAFAALDEDGGHAVGMIHISELSPAYVKEVSDCVSVGDVVTVKVLSVDDRVRIALSRRQAMTAEEQASERGRFGGKKPPMPRVPAAASVPHGKDGCERPTQEDGFEEMLRRFQSASEDRLGALRHSSDGHRSRRRR